MMKRSKKGFTLVELIICCAIITMLAGACTALLMSGEKLFSTGSKSAASQMDVSLLQTTLLNRLPSTKVVNPLTGAAAEAAQTSDDANSTYLFFDDEGVFVIRYGGKNTTIREISEFEYTLNKIGSSDTARTQFSYSVVCKDGTRYTGGMALSTMRFAIAGADSVTYQIKESPSAEEGSTECKVLHFTSDTPTEEGTE